MIPYSLKSKWYNLGPRIASRISTSVVAKIPVTKKCAYLTFDDGPTDGTKQILDCLEQHSMSASFFLTGSQVTHHPEDVKRIVLNHTVGNHLFNHDDPWRMRSSSLYESLQKTDDTIESLTSVRPAIVRPPYGHFTPGLLSKIRGEGRRIILWDCMPGDFDPGFSQSLALKKMMEKIRPGSIIVLHDQGQQHVQTVLIPLLKALESGLRPQGYSFDKIDSELW